MFLHVSQGHWQGRCAYQKGECLPLGLQPSHNLISSSGCTSCEINMKNGVGVTWSQINRPHSVAGQTRCLARNKMIFGWHLQNMIASSQMLCRACSELFLPQCAVYTRFWVRQNPNVAPIKLITFQIHTKMLLFIVVQLLSRVWLSVISLWSVAHQVPLSMGFPRQQYWSGLMFASPPLHYHNSIIQICNNLLSPDSSTVLPKCFLLLNWILENSRNFSNSLTPQLFCLFSHCLDSWKVEVYAACVWLILNVWHILHQPPYRPHPMTYTSTTISKSGSYKI